MANSVYRIRYEEYRGETLVKEIDSEVVTVFDAGTDPYDSALYTGKEIILRRQKDYTHAQGNSVTFNGTWLRDEA
jgi:hypothetical protein